MWYSIARAVLGLAFFIGVAYLLSANRKAINWRLVIFGLLLQAISGFLVLKVPFVAYIFGALSRGFVKLLSFSEAGAAFLLGPLVDASPSGIGFIFAFQILPTIIFFSAVSALLYYFGVLQFITRIMAYVMTRFMGISGVESLAVTGNVFLGQSEAPLLIKPFLDKMSRSELNTMMTAGMATLAGGVLAAYVNFLGGDDPVAKASYAAWLLSASLMNAPAAVVMSKMLLPENPENPVDKSLTISKDKLGANPLDAITRGTTDGLKLAANIGAMLLAIIALIAMLNYILEDLIGYHTGLNGIIATATNHNFSGLSLEYIVGQITRPVAYIMGVPWHDSLLVGSLIGQKTVLNEFIAYKSLTEMIQQGIIGGKAQVISTFALCGFSNFSSIAIQVGGIGTLAPGRKVALTQLGLKALLAASLACLMTGTLAGAMLG